MHLPPQKVDKLLIISTEKPIACHRRQLCDCWRNPLLFSASARVHVISTLALKQNFACVHDVHACITSCFTALQSQESQSFSNVVPSPRHMSRTLRVRSIHRRRCCVPYIDTHSNLVLLCHLNMMQQKLLKSCFRTSIHSRAFIVSLMAIWQNNGFLAGKSPPTRPKS